MDPKSLRYRESHEWASLEGDVCTVGITQFAVDQLTDIVYIDLKDTGTRLAAGDRFGEIESVKAVSDLYAPVGGEVVAVNDKVKGDTEPDHQRPVRQGVAGEDQGDAGDDARRTDDAGAVPEADRGRRALTLAACGFA